jgi:hypothetical protein
MDELHEFCVRMLGDRDAAASVAQAARDAGGADRIGQLAAAVRECRATLADRAPMPPAGGEARDLAEAVAAELGAANARLPQRQREALGLRELLGLSHREIASVIGIESAAVAPLLARSRLQLRAELRGVSVTTDDCPERERTLRTVTLRHDSESVPAADDDWLIDHLGHCAGCARAHAGMLEASVCYRGWRAQAPART